MEKDIEVVIIPSNYLYYSQKYKFLLYSLNYIYIYKLRPKNGGKYCNGDRFDYESCNTHSCPENEDFRDKQCRQAVSSAKAKKSLKLHGFEDIESNSWRAFYSQDPRRKCTLFCKPTNNSHFAVLSPLVTDGTKCSQDSFDICVNGYCLVI